MLSEIEAYRKMYEIISTRLFAGRTIIHIMTDHDPGYGFAPVEGGLEDVYLSTIAAARRDTRHDTGADAEPILPAAIPA